MEVLLKDVRSALSRGEGIKALLLDGFTKCALSPIISHAELLECDFFLFEMISQPRECIDISCVAILSRRSLENLKEEMEAPRYKEYYIFVTDELTRAEIAEIAQRDRHSVVKELQELYLKCVPIDKGLLVSEESGAAYARSVGYILKGLGVVPSVRYLFGSEQSYRTGCAVQNLFAGSKMCNSDVLVLERGFDMFTPLQYPWTYQSMAQEYLSYKNGMISWGDEKLYVSEDDAFFQAMKFRDIFFATESLSESLRHVKASRDTVGEFVSTIRQQAKECERLILHLKALKEISRACEKNSRASEMLSAVIQQEDVGPETVFSSEYTEEQKIRAACVAHLCSVAKQPRGLSLRLWKTDRLLPVAQSRYTHEIAAFSHAYLKSRYERKMPTYEPDKDAKLGYVPVVARLVEKLKAGTLSDHLYPRLSSAPGDKHTLVVVFIGGVTFIEYQSLSQLFAEKFPGQECIIISDKIVTGKDVIQALSEKAPQPQP